MGGCPVFKYSFPPLVVFALFLPLLSIVPQLEGRLFPVTKPMQIAEVVPDGMNGVQIRGTIEKIRDCAFVEVRFFLGTPKARAQVQVQFLEESRVRERGQFEFGPWYVQLTPEQLRGEWFAYALHRCHWGWETRTPLHPAP